ncbi:MAG: 2-oxoacid:acceptor oxidoreductase family protein [Kiritimatiellia bacterium]
MLERVLMAGSGGQGIITIGKLFASTCLDTVPHITFFPAYGAEVRGGTSNCQVILSSEEIPSPVSEVYDSMLIMNQASLDRFFGRASDSSLLIVNTSMCRPPDHPNVAGVDATQAAHSLGNAKAANFIMLGKYIGSRHILKPDLLDDGIRKLFAGKGRDLVELNIKAFHKGLET